MSLQKRVVTIATISLGLAVAMLGYMVAPSVVQISQPWEIADTVVEIREMLTVTKIETRDPNDPTKIIKTEYDNGIAKQPRIVVPAGTYDFGNQPLLITKSVDLEATGALFKFSGGAGIEIGGTVYGEEWEPYHLSLRGFRVNGDGTGKGIFVRKGNQIQYENIRVGRFDIGYAFDGDDAVDQHATNCYASDCRVGCHTVGANVLTWHGGKMFGHERFDGDRTSVAFHLERTATFEISGPVDCSLWEGGAILCEKSMGGRIHIYTEKLGGDEKREPENNLAVIRLRDSNAIEIGGYINGVSGSSGDTTHCAYGVDASDSWAINVNAARFNGCRIAEVKAERCEAVEVKSSVAAYFFNERYFPRVIGLADQHAPAANEGDNLIPPRDTVPSPWMIGVNSGQPSATWDGEHLVILNPNVQTQVLYQIPRAIKIGDTVTLTCTVELCTSPAPNSGKNVFGTRMGFGSDIAKAWFPLTLGVRVPVRLTWIATKDAPRFDVYIGNRQLWSTFEADVRDLKVTVK